MTFIDLDQRELEEPMPGFTGKFIHAETMSLAEYRIQAGTVSPGHTHHHEQINYIVRGKFQFTIEGETRILEPGVAAVVPSNTHHSGVALTDCVLVVTFHPARTDYM